MRIIKILGKYRVIPVLLESLSVEIYALLRMGDTDRLWTLIPNNNQLLITKEIKINIAQFIIYIIGLYIPITG